MTHTPTLQALATQAMLDHGWSRNSRAALVELDAIRGVAPPTSAICAAWPGAPSTTTTPAILISFRLRRAFPTGRPASWSWSRTWMRWSPWGGALDVHVCFNTTSIDARPHFYVPWRLSTDLTSLNFHQDRVAVIVEMTVDANGTVSDGTLYRALGTQPGKACLQLRGRMAGREGRHARARGGGLRGGRPIPVAGPGREALRKRRFDDGASTSTRFRRTPSWKTAKW